MSNIDTDQLEMLTELVRDARTLEQLHMNADDVAAAGDDALTELYHERLAELESNVSSKVEAERLVPAQGCATALTRIASSQRVIAFKVRSWSRMRIGCSKLRGSWRRGSVALCVGGVTRTRKRMTVHELIEALRQMPRDAQVLVKTRVGNRQRMAQGRGVASDSERCQDGQGEVPGWAALA